MRVVSHIQRFGCQPEKNYFTLSHSRSWSAEEGKGKDNDRTDARRRGRTRSRETKIVRRNREPEKLFFQMIFPAQLTTTRIGNQCSRLIHTLLLKMLPYMLYVPSGGKLKTSLEHCCLTRTKTRCGEFSVGFPSACPIIRSDDG